MVKKNVLLGLVVLMLVVVGATSPLNALAASKTGIVEVSSDVIEQSVSPLNVYGFWSDSYNTTFYARGEQERDYVLNNLPAWNVYYGKAFTATTNITDGSEPVYRFWNPITNRHFYTISTVERDYILAYFPQWTYEGVVFYASSDSEGIYTVPVYRLWSDTAQSHFYTTDMDIVGKRVVEGWIYEGITFYGVNSFTDRK